VIRSYASEWIRFHKTARVGILVMVVFVVLISFMVLLGSEEMGPGGEGHGGPFGGAADLASDDGAVAALSTSANLIGIVAIALFALRFAIYWLASRGEPSCSPGSSWQWRAMSSSASWQAVL